MRRIAAGILIPIAGALLFCLFASLWPLRLDVRSLQDIEKVQNLDIPHSSGRFVFLSRDNSMESARIATFGLKQLTFPRGSIRWAVPKENCSGPWPSDFVAVDANGGVYVTDGGRNGDFRWVAAPTDIPARIADSVVIYDSDATRELFEKRWPFVKSAASVRVMHDAPRRSAFGLSGNAFSLMRIIRLSCLFGCFVALVFVLSRFEWDGWVTVAAALPLSVTLVLCLTYLRVPWTPAILWLLFLLIPGELPALRRPRAVLLYALACYALLFLVRLDFDGDFFNNWLPQGRFHYLLGHHDPQANFAYGSIHAASYPPGYGILLSTLMWAGDMNPAASFLPGPDTAFAILLYRVLILALNAALLFLSWRALRNEAWAAALIATLLLIPTTAGKHIGSETLLFPLLATAIALLVLGREIPSLAVIGIALAGMSTLVKWEAALIATFAVLPWLPRIDKRITAAALASLVPTIIWKSTLTVHNRFFVPVTIHGLIAGLPQLPSLAGHAVRLTLDDGRLLLLAIALPCALFLRRNALLVPLGIAALCAGFIVIFLFATYDPPTYIDTSYPRLIMVPVFGAILYCAQALRSGAIDETR